jgi:hypothetical protein
MKSAYAIDRQYSPPADGAIAYLLIVAENHPSSTAINNLFNTGSRGVFLGVVTNLPCWRC